MKQDELYLEAAEKYAAPRPIAGDPSHTIKLRRWNRQRVSVEEIEAAPDSANTTAS